MSDTCPRCLTEETRLEYEGKEQDRLVWRILHCVTCSYTWRDSEPPSTVTSWELKSNWARFGFDSGR